jgi:uroporphyrinogen decarboxylase
MDAPSGTADKALLRTLRGKQLARPPIWLMRQAGRYLPEYRETRARAGSFLDLCYDPDLAAEVTLQPIRRFGFDAAILFADILLIPQALGQTLWFAEGEGPRLEPIDGAAGLRRLRPAEAIHETLEPVYETVRRLSAALPHETTLIGFAGAPWTVATYMVAGRGGLDQAPARKWLYADPAGFGRLIDLLTEATTAYLLRQIEAGAEVVKIFDSWAGALAPEPFRTYAVEPARRITATIKAKHPDVPVIGFPRGAGANYAGFARATGVDAVALDTSVPEEWARGVLQPESAVQGNLDPMLLITGGDALVRRAERLIEVLGGGPYIFNLGHGITPEADPAHVETLVRVVKG